MSITSTIYRNSAELFHINQRILSNDTFATIKYIGIEYDDLSYGKHDGYGYFQCKPNSGAFIIQSRANVGISFMDAVRARYADKDSLDMEKISFDDQKSKIEVQLVGMDAIHKFLTTFENLKRISVCNSKVGYIANNEEEYNEIKTLFPKLEELDISFNLIDKWGTIFNIISEMKLTSFTANNNELDILEYDFCKNFVEPFKKLDSLLLHHIPSPITASLNLAASGCLSNLTTLSLCHNSLTENDLKWDHSATLPLVHTIDLSSNKFASLSGIKDFISLFPNVATLSLNNTPLTTFFTNEADVTPFLNVATFFCNDTVIEDIRSFAFLDLLPKLTDLRVQRNKVSELRGISYCRQVIIALLPRLAVLNSSEVRPRERFNSEIFFVKQFDADFRQNENAKTDIFFKYYPELALKHETVQTSQSSAASATLVLSITLQSMDPNSITMPSKVKNLLPNMTVGQVKSLFSKLFPLAVKDMRLNYKGPASDWPESIEDDLRTLEYYGVQSGGVISMEKIFN